MVLPDGYGQVPAGKLAAVVTCLQMHHRPALRPEREDVPWQLRRIAEPDTSWYRGLFAHVGRDWLWSSRLAMPLPTLAATIRHPDVEVYALSVGDRDEGLLELDFRETGDCELAFFGLTSAMLGTGAGRWLMNRAIDGAWARPIRRLWVHTCTLDHPGALAFYLRSGFEPYERLVEVFDDPRIAGHVPRSAAPGVPLLESPT